MADKAERWDQMKERGKKFLKEIEDKLEDGPILLITHGCFGKMLYAAYYDLDWMKTLKMFHFGNSDLLLLSGDSAPEDTHVFRTEQYNA
jgi:broad specificity phosphatase PhoE